MRKRTLVIVPLLLLALVTGIAIFSLLSPASRLKVTVLFAGYTNSPSGMRLAVFQITNHSDVTIRRWAVYHLESQDNPSLRLYSIQRGSHVLLAAGQSETITLSAPSELPAPLTGKGVWRAVLEFGEYSLKMKVQDRVEPIASGGVIDRLKLYRLYGSPVHFVESDWIEK